MAVKLSRTAYQHAQDLIRGGHVVRDERDDWSEHQPRAADENRFIAEHGIAEYARWHLGVDDAKPADRKAHYKFPYGDFVNVHRLRCSPPSRAPGSTSISTSSAPRRISTA
jgi:hypothetical protein